MVRQPAPPVRSEVSHIPDRRGYTVGHEFVRFPCVVAAQLEAAPFDEPFNRAAHGRLVSFHED